MTCRDCQGSMLAYKFDSLPQDLSDEMSAHLSSCESCRAKMDEWRNASDVFGLWSEEAPPSDLVYKTLSRIEDNVSAQPQAIAKG